MLNLKGIFSKSTQRLPYRKLFIYGAYVTIFVLSLLAAAIDFLIGNTIDVPIDLAYGFLTFLVWRYNRKKREIEVAAQILFWVVVSIEFVFLVTHGVDFDLIFAILIPIIAFVSLPLRKIVINLSLFYLLLFLLLLYYYASYPVHPFLHNAKYMVAYGMAHAFMVSFGIFYHLAIDESVKRLEASNQQKALLLSEVHHRVKNNLNLISSMLGLQMQHNKSLEAKEAIEGNQRRIESMAILHEILYKNKNLNEIGMRQYLGMLARHIIACESLEHKVDVVLEVAPVKLNVDSMIQFGVMLNEMITNTVKHASLERERSEIRITFRRKQEGYQLLYCDNAPSVDQEKLKQGFGYNLISLTVRQLKGKMLLKTDRGLCYDILFDLEVAGGGI